MALPSLEVRKQSYIAGRGLKLERDEVYVLETSEFVEGVLAGEFRCYESVAKVLDGQSQRRSHGGERRKKQTKSRRIDGLIGRG